MRHNERLTKYSSVHDYVTILNKKDFFICEHSHDSSKYNPWIFRTSFEIEFETCRKWQLRKAGQFEPPGFVQLHEARRFEKFLVSFSLSEPPNVTKFFEPPYFVQLVRKHHSNIMSCKSRHILEYIEETRNRWNGNKKETTSRTPTATTASSRGIRTKMWCNRESCDIDRKYREVSTVLIHLSAKIRPFTKSRV